MSDDKDNSLIGAEARDELRLIRHCPLCNRGYEEAAVTVIANAKGVELMHLLCLGCRSALLALFVHTPIGMSSLATMTDLSAVDAQRLSRQAALSDDDVLLFHELLTKEKHTFSELFINS